MTHSGTSRQADALARADRVLVGGTLGIVKLPAEVSFVVARARGSRLWDLDGKEYIDYVLGSGPMILGHAHPAVIEAVRAQLEFGTHYYALNEHALVLAEEIVRAVPCAEKVRFSSTGTEATLHALRLARAFTGKDKVLKFEGGYNGQHDYALMSVTPRQPGNYPTPVPDSAGIPKRVQGDVLVAPFNDTETAVSIIREHRDELAAVLIEPLQRVLVPRRGFLQAVREVTRDLGIVLVFDEVVTGFRLAYGGAQEYYGVVPDIAAFAKTIGGGYPIGAVAGRADIMELCNAARKGSPDYVYFGGTLNGNPVSCVAGLATLAELRKPGVYERLHGLGRRMRGGLAGVLEEEKVPGQVLGDGDLFKIAFADDPIATYAQMSRADSSLAVRLNTELVRRGFYATPDKGYISLAHSEEDIDSYVGAVREILRGFKRDGIIPA